MLVTRAAWGAKDPVYQGNSIAHPKGVAIHWEGPKLGSRPHSQCAGTVRGIQTYHLRQDWADIAYNFLVCEHGYVFEGRGAFRGSAANGTSKANADYLAICALTGQGDKITPLMLDGIKEARDICLKAGVGKAVVGHRDLVPTLCPGDELYAHVKNGTFAVTVATKVREAVKKASRTVVRTVVPRPVLRRGSKGKAVLDLQRGLNRCFPAYSRLTLDSDFGPATERVVKEFQSRCGLRTDGVVGPNTRAVLNKYGIKF